MVLVLDCWLRILDSRPFSKEQIRQNLRVALDGRACLARALYRAFNQRSSISVRMILPQVHLRKPCYDFSFL